MRKGYGDPEFPPRPNEGFLHYLHRYAQDLGYIQANVAPPEDRKRPKRHGGPSAWERIDAIFGVKREPGEDT